MEPVVYSIKRSFICMEVAFPITLLKSVMAAGWQTGASFFCVAEVSLVILPEKAGEYGTIRVLISPAEASPVILQEKQGAEYIISKMIRIRVQT